MNVRPILAVAAVFSTLAAHPDAAAQAIGSQDITEVEGPETLSQANSPKPEIPNPPEFRIVDENFVNVASLNTTVQIPLVSIGGPDGLSETLGNDSYPYPSASGPGGSLVYQRSGFYPDKPIVFSYVDGLTAQSSSGGSSSTFSFRSAAERFSGIGISPASVSMSKTGGVVLLNGDQTESYIDRGGTRYDLGAPGTGKLFKAVSKITRPDGEIIRIYYRAGAAPTRIQTVVSSRGWFLKYLYSDNGNHAAPYPAASLRPTRVVGGNMAYEYCNPSADTCTFAQQWPEGAISWAADHRSLTVVTPAGGRTVFTLNTNFEITAIQEPGSASPSVTYNYCGRTAGDGGVSCTNMQQALYGYVPTTFYGVTARSVRDGVITTYNFLNGAGGYYNYQTSFDPYYGDRSIFSHNDPYFYPRQGAYINYQKSGRGQQSISFVGDATNRITIATSGGVSSTSYQYDDRGNITSETLSPGNGGGETPLVKSWGYEAGCANRLTCNQPQWVQDARNGRTDFVYDGTHGGLLAKTLPADTNGVRPQTRYEYGQRYAWVLGPAGGYVPSEQPIWVLLRERTCRSSAATGNPDAPCLIGGDEVITQYEYGPDQGPNNLSVRGVAVQADGVIQRTCFGYDRFGNKISETKPLANLGQCS